MTTKAHPEEIECFRMPLPDGKFSPDKRYEYTYATRKSWEYIPALGRKDWRYFTNKGFTYAGKWVRSEQRGWGDGGDFWEVFLDDRDAEVEKKVSWDYHATLCWRVSPYASDLEIYNVIEKVIDEVVEQVVAREPEPEPEPEPDVIEHPKCVSRLIHPIGTDGRSNEWSLFDCIFGQPSKCGMLDKAEITTMEAKYNVHPNIAEFWCFITSFFYGNSLLLYLVKEEDWFEGWRAAAGWPDFIHFSIMISVLVMICSAVYHASMIEVIGCADCFLASFVFASVTMSVFGVDIMTQVGVLLGIGTVNMLLWQYSTRLVLIVVGLIYPFAMLSCMKMKSYYGVAVFSLVNLGVLCFLLDRMGVAPLHSVWHILGGGAITVTLYHIVVNGTVMMTNVWGVDVNQYDR
jgi:hypothetical protein